jgi:hypothetical protein
MVSEGDPGRHHGRNTVVNPSALRLPVPPPLEQNLIAERYDAATNLLSQLRAELEKLGRMRTALLRDLLAPTYTAAEPRIAAE